jgi:hypothetical protein
MISVAFHSFASNAENAHKRSTVTAPANVPIDVHSRAGEEIRTPDVQLGKRFHLSTKALKHHYFTITLPLLQSHKTGSNSSRVFAPARK